MEGISIIITAFKSDKFIRACLDSIEYQTFFMDNDNFEVLLGIDSCEKTREKVKEIQHNYRNLRVFWFPKNCGTYTVKTNLVYRGTKPYLLFFDSDDIMFPNLIGTAIKERNKGDLIRFFTHEFTRYDSLKTKKDDLAGGVIFIRKDLFALFGGYQDWICSADTELIYRINQFGYSIYRIDSPLMHRRIHPNSLTRDENTGHNSPLRYNYRVMRGELEKLKTDRELRVAPKKVEFVEECYE